MTTNYTQEIDFEKYIGNVALKRARIAFRNGGQKRADRVYNSVYNSMVGSLNDMLDNNVDDYDAYLWLRLWYENIDEFDRPVSYSNLAVKESDFRGPKAYANYLRNEIKSIKKHIESARRKETESNRKSELNKALNEARDFLSVSPGIYDVNRHGEWLSEKEFNSLVQFCKEIVARYAAVSTTQIAA